MPSWIEIARTIIGAISQTTLDRLDRLVVTFHGNQQIAEFLKRGGAWRSPLGRAFELRQSFVLPTRLTQCDRKLRFNVRVVATGVRAASSGAMASAARPCISNAQPKMCSARARRGSA